MKSRFYSLRWLKGHTTKCAKAFGHTMYLYADVNEDGLAEQWEISHWDDLGNGMGTTDKWPLVYVSHITPQ